MQAFKKKLTPFNAAPTFNAVDPQVMDTIIAAGQEPTQDTLAHVLMAKCAARKLSSQVDSQLELVDQFRDTTIAAGQELTQNALVMLIMAQCAAQKLSSQVNSQLELMDQFMDTTTAADQELTQDTLPVLMAQGVARIAPQSNIAESSNAESTADINPGAPILENYIVDSDIGNRDNVENSSIERTCLDIPLSPDQLPPGSECRNSIKNSEIGNMKNVHDVQLERLPAHSNPIPANYSGGGKFINKISGSRIGNMENVRNCGNNMSGILQGRSRAPSRGFLSRRI